MDNYITIKGVSYDKLKAALRQWIELYSKDLDADVKFELYKNGRGNHVIKVDNRVDNERFSYLVNYLQYPESIEYKAEIEGFITAKDSNWFPKELLNKRILVFVAPDDSDGDNIIVVSSDNDIYKIDFGGKTAKYISAKTYSFPSLDHLLNPEIIGQPKKFENVEAGATEGIKKRFKFMLLLTIGLIAISNLFLFLDEATFLKATFFLGYGLGIWFLLDYKLLQIDKYYLYSLIVSILFLGYGLIIKVSFETINLKLIDLGVMHPITLLVVQRPLRFLYKSILKREPIVDRNPPTFWDFAYSFILSVSLIALPFILVELL